MKQLVMMVLAILIGLASAIGMFYAWLGDIASLDVLASIEILSLLGFAATGSLVVTAGNSADRTAAEIG